MYTSSGLTGAFGWFEDQALEQHDIQEFARLFMQKLSKEMPAADAIMSLFQGKFKECPSCDVN